MKKHASIQSIIDCEVGAVTLTFQKRHSPNKLLRRTLYLSVKLNSLLWKPWPILLVLIYLSNMPVFHSKLVVYQSLQLGPRSIVFRIPRSIQSKDSLGSSHGTRTAMILAMTFISVPNTLRLLETTKCPGTICVTPGLSMIIIHD